MYKLTIPTNTVRCTSTPSRVNLFHQIKPTKQIRTINIQQTNVTGYHGRGTKSAEKSFRRAEKDRAERAALYAKVQSNFKSEESQRRFKRYPQSILQAEKITEDIVNKFEEKDYDEALRLFQESKKSGTQFGTRGYSVALRLLVRKGDMDAALQYFDDIVKEKVPLQVELIDPFLSGYAAAKNLDAVKQWFQKIEEHKLAPTVNSYNALLSVLPTEEELTKAFIELKTKGVQPSTRTYIILMRKFSGLDRFDRVWETYCEARAHHIPPNATFWISLIEHCAKFGQIDYLEKVLFHMVDSHQTRLDYRHWTALLRAFTSLGRWDRLYDMVDEMKLRKQPLDPQIILAVTSSVRASDLIRGHLEFPLNQLHVTGYREAKVQSPKVQPGVAKLFWGFLNDAKPVLMSNVFTPPPATLISTTQAQV